MRAGRRARDQVPSGSVRYGRGVAELTFIDEWPPATMDGGVELGYLSGTVALEPRTIGPAVEHPGVVRSTGRVIRARSEFAGFRFPPEVITLAARWYLRYGLSYPRR